ncbi:LysR family transcriptional regulator [Acetobacterium wieringae]|uniref:LysR family transcriptional regulator n=1 Tax=Acetobacterium wieringae TaxID=52694 RepID=A0A5D0WHK2_9FIRM|nr:LysR family transcriptional regulator [Acetobacterium wieringae]MEA4806753.1 LysR family transcriptional regulator [Acetobacterium wieringae]TYC83639.1 LysR family transcriptional regulator [Acetobacterium wieringae]
MTFQQMEFFITSVRYGSFTATAKKFFTTQPTVSWQILLLEDELGFELLYRHEKPLA